MAQVYRNSGKVKLFLTRGNPGRRGDTRNRRKIKAHRVINDNFGNPSGDRAGNPWSINVALPGIEVETVALHENGHSLGIGHFGPPPDAVLNPVYAGIRHSPLPADPAGMTAVWGSWPNP